MVPAGIVTSYSDSKDTDIVKSDCKIHCPTCLFSIQRICELSVAKCVSQRVVTEPRLNGIELSLLLIVLFTPCFLTFGVSKFHGCCRSKAAFQGCQLHLFPPPISASSSGPRGGACQSAAVCLCQNGRMCRRKCSVTACLPASTG